MSVLQGTSLESIPAGSTRALFTSSRLRRFQVVGLVLADLLATNVAFMAAYYLRYVLDIGGDVPGESHVEFAVYFPVQLFFVALCLIGYQARRSYALRRGTSFAAEAESLLASTAVAAMLVFTLVSLIRYPASSRLMLIYAWGLAFLLALLGRGAIRGVRTQLHNAGFGIERVVVVGNNRLARMVMQMLAQQAHLGYRVLGFVDEATRVDFGRFRALGGMSRLPTLINEHQVDRVIVALPAAQHTDILWVLDHCRRDGVSFSLVPDLFELRLSHLELDAVSGIPLFALNETNIAGWNLFIKRMLDVIVSVVALILLSPVFLLVAIAIKIDSRGPVFFKQRRLGKGSEPFTCFKFRSMRVGAEEEQEALVELNEAEGPIFKIRRDPRSTRVGRVIRRLSIDELPQFLNVFIGNMSVVGPRPPIPAEVERYQDWHVRRLEVTPGITGLWQVSGRSELAFDEMVMLDIYYIENWSLTLDLQIMARTIPAVFRTAGAF